MKVWRNASVKYTGFSSKQTLFLATLFFCAVEATKLGIDDLTWQRPNLPNLAPVAEIERGQAEFKGHVKNMLRVDCDLDCQVQKGRQPLRVEDIENDLSYETLDVYRQVRISTVVNVSDVPAEMLRANETTSTDGGRSLLPSHRRNKRAVFGYDTRYKLPMDKFSTMYPFSTVVKLSTGCAGVLVSPRHVLTSAHCIHNGKKYLKGVRKLRIGRFVDKKIRKRGKKGRKGRKKKKKRKNRKASHLRPNRQHINNETSTTLARSRRSIVSRPKKFKWTRARRTHIPQPWLQQRGQRDTNLMVEYDYAVVELKRPLGTDHMKIGISPVKEHLPRNQRIHFTAFDQVKKPTLLYRYCAVEEQSADMMYHYCDSEKGTSGAGIYVRLYDRDTRSWDRRIIGVFSGHQWVDMGEQQPPKEYNTGVRITPLKFAQICFWTTGDYSRCREN